MTPRTLSELAALCGADVVGDGSRLVLGAARLDEAGPQEVSFLTQSRYRAHLASTRAGGVVLAPQDQSAAPAGLTLLVVRDPESALNTIALAFAPDVPARPTGVHPTAVVDATAELGADVTIGPFCEVGPGAVVADGVTLHARVSIGAGVRIGARCELHPGVVVYPHCTLGAHCIVHAGTVIGADGFGFRPTARGWEKTPQVGTVVIGEHVEIGANCTIDRGRFGPTKIGAGSKLDNLVHVGHNVDVGEGCLLIAQVGIAGSTRLGRGVIVAGQAGVAGHLEVGPGARIGAGAGVIQDVPKGTDWFGYPARPRLQAMRETKELERLAELRRRVSALEKRLGATASEEGEAQ